MRICLYTETALPKIGGQELVVDALARGLQTAGHDVVVLAQQPRRPLVAQDDRLPYPVVRHPRFVSTWRLVSWYRHWLLKLHRRWPFDVLHAHSVHPCGYLGALVRERLGTPLVITSHGGDVRDGNARFNKPGLRERSAQALNKADALIAISRFTADGYRRLAPGVHRIEDIPNGVHLEPFASLPERPVGLDDRIRAGKFLLFLGRLHRRKGVDVLLDALAKLQRQHDDMRLVVAGDGDERPALESQVERLGLADRVSFVGSVSGATKTWLLANAFCLTLPSRTWEAFPLVVLEGYAAGCAVIGSRIAGLEDLIQPGQTGYLVPPESPADWAATLTEAFTNRPQMKSMGAEARRVAQDYSWQAVTQRHVELYRELCATPAVRAA